MPDLDLDAFTRLARSRRSNLCMNVDARVPVALVDELCTLATWAPNHKRTWPWRFAVFTGDGRRALGAAFARSLPDDADAGRVEKTATKYLRAPVVIVVGVTSGDPARRAEDRDAAAAAVQTLLLGATAAGLASFWSSPPVPDAAEVAELAGMPVGSLLVAVIYLGWATRAVATPRRPAPEIVHVGGTEPDRVNDRR